MPSSRNGERLRARRWRIGRREAADQVLACVGSDGGGVKIRQHRERVARGHRGSRAARTAPPWGRRTCRASSTCALDRVVGVVVIAPDASGRACRSRRASGSAWPRLFSWQLVRLAASPPAGERRSNPAARARRATPPGRRARRSPRAAGAGGVMVIVLGQLSGAAALEQISGGRGSSLQR